ncbi:unnamed protein product, partial [Closterium sp. Naga37s-1]
GPSQLQQNKVTDLIRISTDRRDDFESVEVSLHFEKIVDLEVDTSKAVPGSKSGILSTNLCNDTTKHDVDNHDSLRKVITTPIKNKGVDLSKDHFHVLQGELERVAMMKAKAQWSHEEGLLEYLEKVFGTNKYIEQIKEKSRRLEDLNTKRVGFMERMQLAETEKEQLEEQKKAAEVFLLKEAQRTQLNMAAVYLQQEEREHTMKRSSSLAADLERAIEADSMQEKRVSDEDMEQAGLSHALNEALGEWLEAAGGDSVFVDEGAEAETAEGGVENVERSEAAEGSEAVAQCQVIEPAAHASEEAMQKLGRLLCWLCSNCMSAGSSHDEVLTKHESVGEELKALREKVDISYIDKYHKKEDVFFERFFEAADVTLERNAVKQEHEGLIRHRQDEFTAGLDAIRMRVKGIYQIMAPGGDADLAPVDPLDPFTQGIHFSVRPPQQQRWRSMADLDGREQVRAALWPCQTIFSTVGQ